MAMARARTDNRRGVVVEGKRTVKELATHRDELQAICYPTPVLASHVGVVGTMMMTRMSRKR